VSQAAYKVVIQAGANHVVDLSWKASTTADVVGYNVYRSPDGATWKKINVSRRRSLPVQVYDMVGRSLDNRLADADSFVDGLQLTAGVRQYRQQCSAPALLDDLAILAFAGNSYLDHPNDHTIIDRLAHKRMVLVAAVIVDLSDTRDQIAAILIDHQPLITLQAQLQSAH
jgi:hypothetical protein